MFSDEMKKSPSMFVKLEDGEKVLGVFYGPPLEYKNNYKLKTDYPMGMPSYPEGTSNRFKVNFLVPVGDGTFVAKVLNGSGKLASSIESVTGKYGQTYIYEITRLGEGTKTTYSVLPERALTDDEKSKLPTTKLNELTLKTQE